MARDSGHLPVTLLGISHARVVLNLDFDPKPKDI